MRIPALAFSAATLLVIACLPGGAQEIIKDKPTPSRAEWAPLGQNVRSGLFDIRRNQGRRSRQWDAGG
jgi:hypothetical protein